MDYDLRRLHHIIYDEADRWVEFRALSLTSSLFEMGFKPQIDEILLRLPSGRHSLLFSATLPPMLSEFTRAGLSNPILHRIDNEQSLSPDLQLGFFWTTPAEKVAAMLAVLQEIVDVRPSQPEMKTSTQIMIFVATKHHVEYLTTLLRAMGYRVSFIYGSLHQVARREQLTGFRSKATEILIVTDVAARGIDIPIMDHVLNYDLPSTSQQFIHRVGRTARAGRKGSAFSLVTRSDLPYLMDIDLSLDLGLHRDRNPTIGAIPRELMDHRAEGLRALGHETPDLVGQYGVLVKSQALFERTRSRASASAYLSTKGGRLGDDDLWIERINPLFAGSIPNTPTGESSERTSLINAIRKYQPQASSHVAETGKALRSQPMAVLKKPRTSSVPPKQIERALTKPCKVGLSSLLRAAAPREWLI